MAASNPLGGSIMLETTQQSRSPVQLDPAAHDECLEFVRIAIASNDRQTVIDIKNVLAEVCNSGYADRAAIWADLTQTEVSNSKNCYSQSPTTSPRESNRRSAGIRPELPWVLIAIWRL